MSILWSNDDGNEEEGIMKTGQRKKQKCTNCEKTSIPGLKPGRGKCPYHWAAGVWGVAWADGVERRTK